MGEYAIKSVTFGGFDKQDVVTYIEKITRESADREQKLRDENETLQQTVSTLRTKLESLQGEVELLRRQVPEMKETQNRLQAELDTKTAEQVDVQQMQAALADLRAENAKLRPDAEAFAQFRERIGSIECEARKRADDLEISTNRQLRQTIDTFQEQYQQLMSTFETASGFITAELRKIEVNLTQLPRAMDQTGAELRSLLEKMEQKKERE